MSNRNATMLHHGGLIKGDAAFDLCEALNVLAHDWGLYDLKARLDAIPFRTTREKYTDLDQNGKDIYDLHHSWLKIGSPKLKSHFAPTYRVLDADYIDLLHDSPGVLHFMMLDRLRDRYTSAAFCPRCKGWTVFGDELDCERYGLIRGELPIEYNTCTHMQDVCPDCNTNLHPGCCGEDA